MKYLRGLLLGIFVGFLGTLCMECILTQNGSEWMEKTADYWRSC